MDLGQDSSRNPGVAAMILSPLSCIFAKSLRYSLCFWRSEAVPPGSALGFEEQGTANPKSEPAAPVVLERSEQDRGTAKKLLSE